MGLKIALELILKYYLLNKTKILSILEAKILKTVNYIGHGCFNSTSKEFQFLRTNKKGFDKMNLEEYKKYVKEMCKNIKEKLDEESEEFDFFLMLVKTFNKICNENLELEQALDEIEKIIRQPQFEYDNIPCNYENDIEKIKEIIQKTKGDFKNGNK